MIVNHSHITDPHITAWLLSLILFVIALILNKRGNVKGFKIFHMILRVFYLLIILTGGMLLFSLTQITFLYVIKVATGLWIISLFELILTRKTKEGRMTFLWIQFAIALIFVLYLGFKLPLGIHIF